MPVFNAIRMLLQSAVSACGYRIERKYDFGRYRLDVLDLVVDRLDPLRSDFFFVQVGANNGEDHDQINAMIRRYNWRGILLEPQPDVFADLVRNYAGHDRLIFENAALGYSDGEQEFWTVPGEHGLGSFDKGVLRRSGFHDSETKQLLVKTVSAQTLLAKHAVGHIDLLQVDAEGFDFEVIKMFLAAGSLPTVINYEHLHLSDTNRRSCVAWLGGLGYKMLQAGPERIDTVAYRSAPADPQPACDEPNKFATLHNFLFNQRGPSLTAK
jgi:FkbM family methyltransferase